MTLELDTPGTTWQVRYDAAVVESLRELDDGVRADVREAVETIPGKPLGGSGRTVSVDGKSRAVRVKMASYAAVVWEVNPGREGRADTEADVESVYVHGVVVRGVDGEFAPGNAVRGERRPADSMREFGVRFAEFDVQDRISDLHAADHVEVNAEEWREDGVLVGGVVKNGRHDSVVETASAADVRFKPERVAPN